MSLNKPIPRIVQFDERDPDKVNLYPFPYPDGVRCIAITDGNSIKIYDASSGYATVSITGFVPAVEQALMDLYMAIYSEPAPGYTHAGKLLVNPQHVFDIILFDKDNGGAGSTTNKLLDDWCFDPEWPAPANAVCALVITHMPYTSFTQGRDTVDLWDRRASLKRGLVKIGMANPYANPSPLLRFMTIAPDHWDWPLQGCAGRPMSYFWRQVQNCFDRGYKGCLVLDVWQPWAVKSDAFQLITEEDVI